MRAIRFQIGRFYGPVKHGIVGNWGEALIALFSQTQTFFKNQMVHTALARRASWSSRIRSAVKEFLNS